MKKIMKLAMILIIGIIGNISCSKKFYLEEKKSPLHQSLKKLSQTIPNIAIMTSKGFAPHSKEYKISYHYDEPSSEVHYYYKDNKTGNIETDFHQSIELNSIKKTIEHYKKKDSLNKEEKTVLKTTQKQLKNINEEFKPRTALIKKQIDLRNIYLKNLQPFKKDDIIRLKTDKQNLEKDLIELQKQEADVPEEDKKLIDKFLKLPENPKDLIEIQTTEPEQQQSPFRWFYQKIKGLFFD